MKCLLFILKIAGTCIFSFVFGGREFYVNQKTELTPDTTLISESPFGVHLAGPINDKYLSKIPWIVEQIKDLGAQWLRVNFMWSSIDGGESKLDWSIADSVVRHAKYAGISLLFNVRGYTFMSFYSENENLKLKAYERFIREFIRRYKEDVHYWQIENEIAIDNFWNGTENQYLQVLETAYNAIKKEDSLNTVLLAGFPIGEKYTTTNLNILRLANNFYDAIDLHLYQKPDDILNIITFYREKMRSMNSEKPILVTETGGPFPEQYKDNLPPGAHSSEIIKRYILALSEGVQQVFWHGLEGPKKINSKWDRLALIRGGYRTLGFETYRTLSKMLNKAHFITRIKAEQGIWAFQCAKDTGEVFIIWADGSTSIAFPTKEKGIIVTNMYGQNYSLKSSIVKISPNPVFVQIKFDSNSRK